MNETSTVSDLLVGYVMALQGTHRFPGFRWNKGLARYQDRATGRIVSQKQLLDLGEKYIADVTKDNIETMTAKMLDGTWTLEQWQTKVAMELKDAYTVETLLGRGGVKMMTPADWGRMGGRLGYQYRRLENFAFEIKDGKLVDGQIEFRARMYGDSARQAFYDGSTAAHKESGFTHEQRFLTPAEHCDDCMDYAAMGIVPIGTLPEPGQESACMTNCKCYKEYYTEQEDGSFI